MTRRSMFDLSAIAVLGFGLLPGVAFAQQKTLKQELVGTWSFVRCTGDRSDDSSQGEPKGQLIFAADGSYSNIRVQSDLQTYASDDETDAVPRTSEATPNELSAGFGTYDVNETDQSLTLHINGSFLPDRSGTNSTRKVAYISNHELRIDNRAPSSGGPASQLVFQR